MIHSYMDNEIWEEEFELMVDQDHFDRMWSSVCSKLPQYITSYLDYFSRTNPSFKPEANISLYINQLINEHKKTKDKYWSIFKQNLMDDYQEDVDGFKGDVLSKRCMVIQRTLNSKTEALKDWKIAYKLAKSQELYDTFYNMFSFAADYDNDMSEDEIENIATIEEIGLSQMREDACYLQGVIGTGIVSTVLNAMYPRLFPGQFKIGMFALFMLSDKKTTDMESDTSEFLMVKDDIQSKTGIIETEHNYYYPYETFGLYSLNIYRMLDEELDKRFNVKFPDDYRYVLTNDFYQYVVELHKEDIKTLLGNDDILKYPHAV